MYPIELFHSTLTKAVEVLNRYGIRFHLTGGITAVAYGEPRMTQDLDFVVDYDAALRSREAFLSALLQAGFHLELASARKALDGKVMFQILDIEQALKLDLYPEAAIPGELARRRRVVEVDLGREGKPQEPPRSAADLTERQLRGVRRRPKDSHEHGARGSTRSHPRGARGAGLTEGACMLRP